MDTQTREHNARETERAAIHAHDMSTDVTACVPCILEQRGQSLCTGAVIESETEHTVVLRFNPCPTCNAINHETMDLDYSADITAEENAR